MKKALVWISSTVTALAIVSGAFWLGKKQADSTDIKSSQYAPNTSTGAAFGANSKNTGNDTKGGSTGGNSGSGTAVEVMKVQSTKLAQNISAVGSLRSDESVVIRPEVAGRVAEILFTEGARVVKGAPLVRLDASVQRAELAQADANLSLSKSKLERAIDLQKKGFISSQAKDEADNNARVSQAGYDLAAAKLTKLEVKAPFSGIVGLRLVSLGDYVKDGQDIVNLEGVDPLKVDFKVPEIFLKQVAVGQALQIGLDAFPNKIFDGRVFAINPLVDANGRSIVIRAIVKNGEARLRPGMFARVRLLFGESQDSLTVPEQTLFPIGDDQYLYKVVDGRAQRLKVDIGQRKQGQVEITQGLKAGDIVVTAGQPKLKDGALVKIVDAPSATRSNGEPVVTKATTTPTTTPTAAPTTAPAAIAGAKP